MVAPSEDASPPQRLLAVPSPAVNARDLDGILQKLKLLEFGLYGLQQYGQNAPFDPEDLGSFYRLAEEIQADVLTLQQRLAASSEPDTKG